MTMKPFYMSVFEWISKRNFEVWVPAYYHPFMPKHITNPDRTPRAPTNRWKMVATKKLNPLPFRQVVDPAQMQRASFSIEIMLDMFVKKIEFELYEEEDIIEILEGLDRYLNAVRREVGLGEEKTITFVKSVLAWREEVYKHYYRFMQNNPVVKAKLYPNEDPTKNLVHILNLGRGVTTDAAELDPLFLLSHPPYDLQSTLPRDPNDTTNPDLMMESSLGLSSSRPVKDTGKDFDIDGFLGRK